MSEERGGAPDISKVISVIMENPDILERISTLIKSDTADSAVIPPPEPEVSGTVAPTYTEAVAQPTGTKHTRRAQLLGALKPYVKKERAQAIDSVIAIADILDMMRGK